MRAAIQVMGERGVSESRLADIAAQAGISPGQVLYYFEGKTDLFMQALCTIEQDLRDDVLAAINGLTSTSDRWNYLLQVATPTGSDDSRVLLWLEAWELAARDPVISSQLHQLEQRWRALLRQILDGGRQSGVIECKDLDAFIVRFSALMDGLTIQVIVGSDAVDRERMLDICWQVTRAELQWVALPRRD